MSKTVKYGLIALGFLVALITVAAIVIPRVFDPNGYKDQIAAQVEQRTGRKLQLPGKIGLSVFPWVALELGDLSLSNAAGFSADPQLRLRHLQARVKLLPLLYKRIEMGTIVIDGLALNLEKDRQGKTNWDDLVQKLGASEPAARAEAPEQKPATLAALAIGGLALTDASVSWDDRDKQEHYLARHLAVTTGPIALGQPLEFELATEFEASKQELQGELAGKGVATADLDAQHYVLDLTSLNTELKGKALPQGTTAVALAAKVEADLKRNFVQVSGLNLNGAGLRVTGDMQVADFKAATPSASYKLTAHADELAPLLHHAAAELKLGALPRSLSRLAFDFAVDGTAERARIAPFKVELALEPAGARPLSAEVASKQVEIDIPHKTLLAVGDGKLTLTGDNIVPVLQEIGVKSPALQKLAVALHVTSAFSGSGSKLNAQAFNAKATVAGEGIPNKSTALDVTANLAADLARQAIEVDKLTVKGLGLDLHGNLQAADLQGEPKYHGDIQLAPFDARQLLAALGQPLPASADPKVLTNIALSTKLNGSKSSLALNDLALRLDDSHLQGQLGVSHFADPAIDFNLSLDGIDADRYLPPKPPAGTASSAPKPAPPAAAHPAELPVKTLRSLNLKGPISIGKLKIAKASLTNIKLVVTAHDGLVQLTPVTAALYQGQLHADVTLDARTRPPQLTVQEALTGMQVEPLLTELSGKESKLAGTTEFKTRLNAAGGDVAELRKSLNGTGAFAFRNGAIKGINIVKLICDATSRALGDGKLNSADFANLLSASNSKNTGERTEFSEMQGTFNIAQGILGNKDFEAKSPLLRAGGSGSINLVSEQIDYTLPTELVGTCEGQGGHSRDDLKGITIPVKISGAYSAPKVGIDLESLVKARAQKLLGKEQEKLQKKLQEKLPGSSQIQDKLKGILKF